MKKKDNIIYINGRFLTQKITGVQRYAIEVVKKLDLIKSDYKFILLIPKKGVIQELELQNIEKINIGKFTGHIWEQISLPLYILTHKKKAKLLSLCNLAPILYPGYTTIHDIAFKTNSKHLSKKFTIVYKLITKLNIKRYKHIFTASNFSKNEIIENYNVKPDRVTVTYNSAEHLNEIQPDNEIINKLGLKDKEFYFSLGSKSPHKNHKFIVECAKNNPEMLFVVSGNNDNKVFRIDNEEMNIENLIYTGYLNDNELVALYQKCIAFLFPSLYEGFGIPPLEAITKGCKNVILSNIEVHKEIYGEYCTYIDIKNMEFESKNIRNKINKTKDYTNLLKKYSWKNTAEKIFVNLIKEGKNE